MGFRDALTSATDVDTTTTAGSAGVIIAGGRATFQDGAGGNGYIEATSSGGTLSSSRFDVVGPLGGTTQQRMRQYLQDLPAGGYAGVLELDGDIIRLGHTIEPLIAPTLLTPVSTYFAQLETPENNYSWPRYTKGPDGFVDVYGLVKVTNISFAAGQPLFAPLPAGCRPRRYHFVTLTGWSVNGEWTAQLAPDGTIRWQGNVVGTSTVGGWLSVTGIRFLAEL